MKVDLEVDREVDGWVRRRRCRNTAGRINACSKVLLKYNNFQQNIRHVWRVDGFSMQALGVGYII